MNDPTLAWNEGRRIDHWSWRHWRGIATFNGWSRSSTAFAAAARSHIASGLAAAQAVEVELRLPATLRLAAARGGVATAARSNSFAGRSSDIATAARSGFAAARLAAALQVVTQAVFPATLRLATRNWLTTRRRSDFAAAATQRERLGVAGEHENTSHQGGSHQNPTLHGRAPKINKQIETI